MAVNVYSHIMVIAGDFRNVALILRYGNTRSAKRIKSARSAITARIDSPPWTDEITSCEPLYTSEDEGDYPPDKIPGRPAKRSVNVIGFQTDSNNNVAVVFHRFQELELGELGKNSR